MPIKSSSSSNERKNFFFIQKLKQIYKFSSLFQQQHQQKQQLQQQFKKLKARYSRLKTC